MAESHSLHRRVVDQSAFDKGDTAFIILCSALVLFMVPGLAFLYAGLVRRKNALHIIMAVIFSNAVTIIQFYVWGYSLGFSPTATNGFIGDLNHAGLNNAVGGESPGTPLLPNMLYAFFQMEFACVTVAIMVGALAERGRLIPLLLFVFVWVTLVYNVLTAWVWAPGGWAFTWGVLDYAGGGPVEIGSGVGGLALAWAIGPRKPDQLVNFRPHNVSLVVLGTFMLWFGWLGFNAGSAFGSNLRAVYSAWNSNLCAAGGGIAWCLLDMRTNRKFTVVGFCSGTIAGLVAATPCSGFVPAWAALATGIFSGAVCNYATKLKYLVKIDDSLDIFAEHAIGGIIGLLSNAFFAADYVISLDDVSTSITGGFINHNWKQLYQQFAYICAAVGWTFVMTALIAKAFDLVPFLRLRASEAEEEMGMDDAEIGEFVQDYVELRRHWEDAHSTDDKSSDDNGTVTNGADIEKQDTNKNQNMFAAGDRHGVPDHNA